MREGISRDSKVNRGACGFEHVEVRPDMISNGNSTGRHGESDHSFRASFFPIYKCKQ